VMLGGDAGALTIDPGSMPVRVGGKGEPDHEVVRQIRCCQWCCAASIAAPSPTVQHMVMLLLGFIPVDDLDNLPHRVAGNHDRRLCEELASVVEKRKLGKGATARHSYCCLCDMDVKNTTSVRSLLVVDSRLDLDVDPLPHPYLQLLARSRRIMPTTFCLSSQLSASLVGRRHQPHFFLLTILFRSCIPRHLHHSAAQALLPAVWPPSFSKILNVSSPSLPVPNHLAELLFSRDFARGLRPRSSHRPGSSPMCHRSVINPIPASGISSHGLTALGRDRLDRGTCESGSPSSEP